jgi:hypothetical protein
MDHPSGETSASTEKNANRFLEALAVLAVVVEPGRSFSLTLTLTTGEDG